MRHGWERQREITVREIYLKVPKGINKVSELSFATMVAGFLDFKMIYFHILGPKHCILYFFMHYLHFNVLTTDKLYTVYNIYMN